jgi:cell division protease FtsH
MSEDTARLIDQEIRRIVTEGEDLARKVIGESRHDLEAITQALMEYETITGEECQAVMRGEKIVRREDDEDTKGPIGSAVPTAGKVRPPREEPDTGGMAPQPQA